jgi:hypothetical protein
LGDNPREAPIAYQRVKAVAEVFGERDCARRRRPSSHV